MDIHAANELSEVADIQIQKAEEYFEARKRAGDALTSLDLLLAASLSEFRDQKKNLGIDMARMMLMENSMVARGFYKEWVEQEHRYKGLERLLDARASKISIGQSIMKYQSAGEKYG